MTKLDHLTGPATFRCGAVAPNHFALAPMTNTQSREDGTLGDDELEWLVRRAKGGFGIVLTCASYVSEEGKAWSGQLGVSSASHVDGLTRLASALHEFDACSLVQLHHAGAKATLAPELKLSTVDSDGVKGATLEDIERVVDDYVSAALRAQEAGFDGVEIHGANGYIFTQFLAPEDNPRDDAYGGSLEGRARFLRETLQAVRNAVREDFVVGVRMSPVDTWTRRGLVLADSLVLADWLVDDGADYIHLSLQDAQRSPPFEEDVETPVARAFRERLPDEIPVMAAGNIWTRNGLKSAVAAGVDLPAIGRAAIGNPDWAASVLADWQPVVPPWSLDYLESQKVGEAFRDYLGKFNGLIATD